MQPIVSVCSVAKAFDVCVQQCNDYEKIENLIWFSVLTQCDLTHYQMDIIVNDFFAIVDVHVNMSNNQQYTIFQLFKLISWKFCGKILKRE